MPPPSQGLRWINHFLPPSLLVLRSSSFSFFLTFFPHFLKRTLPSLADVPPPSSAILRHTFRALPPFVVVQMTLLSSTHAPLCRSPGLMCLSVFTFRLYLCGPAVLSKRPAFTSLANSLRCVFFPLFSLTVFLLHCWVPLVSD